MKKIAVLGLGIMGGAIVDNFLKSGYEVYIWNRSPAAVNNYEAKGAYSTRTPAEAASRADMILEITADDESSKMVWLGSDGILKTANDKKYLITCATVSVKWVDELAAICKQKNLTFFDMPMTGGRIAAEKGELTLLVGGDKQKLRRILPQLKAIAKEVKYFGKTGNGMRYKLVLNMLQAVHIVGFTEAMKLAKIAGLDEKLVAEALIQRPGGVLTAVAWEGYQKQPEPINFSVKWIQKDLNYAKQLSKKSELSFLEMAIKIYDDAINAGLAESDWTKITTL